MACLDSVTGRGRQRRLQSRKFLVQREGMVRSILRLCTYHYHQLHSMCSINWTEENHGSHFCYQSPTHTPGDNGRMVWDKSSMADYGQIQYYNTAAGHST